MVECLVECDSGTSHEVTQLLARYLCFEFKRGGGVLCTRVNCSILVSLFILFSIYFLLVIFALVFM